jgi:hypothetical protein
MVTRTLRHRRGAVSPTPAIIVASLVTAKAIAPRDGASVLARRCVREVMAPVRTARPLMGPAHTAPVHTELRLGLVRTEQIRMVLTRTLCVHAFV